jgi:hypothetical protein
VRFQSRNRVKRKLSPYLFQSAILSASVYLIGFIINPTIKPIIGEIMTLTMKPMRKLRPLLLQNQPTSSDKIIHNSEPPITMFSPP